MIEYNRANQAFNNAFLRVALDSIQGFQQRLMKMDAESMPKSLRELYDLWVEISEEHYAEFAMGEEYQELYGDMVNRLMTMRKHYSEMTDDLLRAMNLPNTREVDTMQERLQQLRRENFALKKEIGEIKAMLQRGAGKAAAAPAPAAPEASKPAAARKAKAPAKKAAARKAVAKKAPAKKKTAVTNANSGA
jgi:hypothetical protein